MTSFSRLACLVVAMSGLLGAAASAQRADYYDTPEDTRAALSRALREQEMASRRGQQLEQEAARATDAADRTARQAAALAARIQQSEAGLLASEARLRLVTAARGRALASLAQRQKPAVRLTAALQNLSRRPMALALLRPGSVRDMVYLRAVMATTLPQVAHHTAALRAQIARLKALEGASRAAIAQLRRTRGELADRKTQLAALETRQRLEARARGGVAAREADRALALAEQARDLNGLLSSLDAASAVRVRLAALPGPIMRPARPEQSTVLPEEEATAPADASAPMPYLLPVAGRTVAGFGAVTPAGLRSQGITLAPQPGAQVVSPGAGRIAFAGPYRGYGSIVIIEHPGGWTSLVTGLARVDAGVGEELVAGAPLGIAAPVQPAVTLELHHGAETVNPLDHVG